MAIADGQTFADGEERQRAVKILARSLVRELRGNGYTPRQIVGLSTEIVGLIAEDLRRRSDVSAGPR